MNPNLKSLLQRIEVDLPHEYNSLREYGEAITHLSENELSIEFNNKDANHAKMVMVELFSKAKKEIKIFANCFSGEISDDIAYITSLREAIERGVDVTVILENDPNPNSKCIEMLKMLLQNNISNLNLFKLHDEIKKEIISKNSLGELLNFTVVDEQMFRFENDTKHFKAICNFDDPFNATILKNNFKKLSIKAIPIN